MSHEKFCRGHLVSARGNNYRELIVDLSRAGRMRSAGSYPGGKSVAAVCPAGVNHHEASILLRFADDCGSCPVMRTAGICHMPRESRTMVSRCTFAVVACTVLSLVNTSSAAIVFTFGVEVTGSGGTLSGPVTLLIENDPNLATDFVDFTIDTTGLDATLDEFISGLYLNLDPSLDPTKLQLVGSDVPVPTLNTGANSFHTGANVGHFDIFLDFPTAGGNRVEADEIYTFTLSYPGPVELDESDFYFLSFDPPTGEDEVETYAILRAQGLGPDASGSGFFAPLVPEPTSALVWLIGAGGVGLALRRRLKRPVA